MKRLSSTRKLLFASTFVSVALTILSLIYKDRISSKGLFSLYRGPTYWAYGRPVWMLKCYENGSCQYLFGNVLLNLLFYFLLTLLVIKVYMFLFKMFFLKKKK